MDNNIFETSYLSCKDVEYLYLDKSITTYYKDVQTLYDEKFEELLINYLDKKLCIRDKTIDYLRDNYERLGLTGFGVHYYMQGSKKQFVNEKTKEVLFEVGIEVGNIIDSSIVWWKVYWE